MRICKVKIGWFWIIVPSNQNKGYEVAKRTFKGGVKLEFN